jgi:hypothetical protein
MSATPQLETLSFAVLVDEAWRSTRSHFRALFLPFALALAGPALVLQLFSVLWSLYAMGLGTDAGADFFCGAALLAAAGGLAVAVGYFLVFGSLMVAASQACAGQATSFATAFRAFLRPRLWGTELLAWILIGLGLMACLVPGLFLLALWALRLPVATLEGHGGFSALGRSWELLTHNPSGIVWRHPAPKAFLLIVLGVVLAYAVTMVIELPFSLLSFWLSMREAMAGLEPGAGGMLRTVLWLSVPAGVVAAMAQLAVQLYVNFAVAHLYLDQRRRKEGTDLEEELGRLQSAHAFAVPEPGR